MAMNPQSSKESARPLLQTEQAALINLLIDDDPAIYHSIREKILSYGADVIPWLRTFHLDSDPATRRRTQEIITTLERQQFDSAFLGFCLKQGEDLDLEDGVFLLARTQYPNINVVAYRALLDSFAQDLKAKIGLRNPPETTLGTVNEHLFEHLTFRGNEENYYDPENSYLNRVMDRRIGNPISICIIYMLVARRLGLPITGIGLPGHFVCRFQSPMGEFYIDTFNRGKLLTKADCIKFLHDSNHTLQEGHLIPLSPRRMLLRICANLHQIYSQTDLSPEVSRFQRYLVALAK